MTRARFHFAAIALAVVLTHSTAAAQSDPKLHVSSSWKECSLQLDPSLTQSAWRQFTREAALVVYFRPVADARPLGRGKFEASIVQWKTGIDARTSAWNDTFVHPDSTHWLFEGSGLEFPGLTARVGVTNRTDAGFYYTKNPNANYGFAGAQVQHAFIADPASAWALSARASVVSLFGPKDIGFHAYGADVITSRTLRLNRWAALSPYASVSGYLSQSHEKSALVSLEDVTTGGSQATLGAALQLSVARLGAEYSVATVRSVSLKVGVGF
jgi:hypothetical protein